MKKSGKILILALCCALLFSSGVLAAGSVKKTIEVTYRDIKLVVDGVPVTPKDANGSVVEPFIYNGTTYLPVRAVGEALGKTVSWDGATSTVYIGEADSAPEKPTTVQLKDLKSVSSNPPRFQSEVNDNYGNHYDNALRWGYGYEKQTFEYLFNMKYSRLTATLCIPELESNNTGVYLKIVGDGQVLYKSPEMVKQSYPEKIDIDISDYNDIKFVWTSAGSGLNAYDHVECFLADAVLYQ